ncbi:MAG TPA: glutamate formimidoyltransferase [Candidatus Omnitrophota bacterium]|nr:glutamate formimidoyltransferase [Candidatus Omnitrophota bacterium]
MLECVPNFSEGRDDAVIGEIVSAVRTAKVLNVHSDPDHNRTVVTMTGKDDGVRQAAFDLTMRAVQLLDIKDHAGTHPFIGVMDVIPFIPLSGSDMKKAVAVAHELGKELWEKIKLPVYFYGQAAKVAERRDLPFVRKGGYAALRREIKDKHRRPDVGEGLHSTGGAAAVGARNFLIAYNVNLKTSDIDIARSIAKNVREKNGGLPGVRALGMFLESRGIAQVSVNITDHNETPVLKVFDQVADWAKEYGTSILESELVGLAPKGALDEATAKRIKLKDYTDKMILENNL